jgi:Mrp family chromosome partitioning ATPase/capsular polysaccharide biosynthesis protein
MSNGQMNGANGQPGPQGGYNPQAQGPGYPAEPEREGLTLRDYVDVLWRRKWVILLVVVVATASAYFFSARQTKQYAATATMFYKQQIDIANPLTGGNTDSYSLDREMTTIGDVMVGPEIQRRATAVLEGANVDMAAGYSVAAAQQKSTAGGATSSSNVVVVTGDSPDAKLAAAAANAYIAAYIAWDAEQYRNQIERAIPVLQEQLAKYTGDAAKLTSDYVLLKQRLQDLQILKATADGSYRALTPATVPSAPYAPNPLRSAILGFAVGLFAGIGLAFLLEQFDTRVRKTEEVATILRQPILGRVPRIPKYELAESSLVALLHPDGREAEAFRLVRTNLEFMAVDGDIRTLVLTSAMQGDGKSVTVANLAISMAMAGKKVILVDADMRRPRQAKMFGLENEVGLSTVLAGKHRVREALVRVEVAPAQEGSAAKDFEAWAGGSEALSRLYVLPSGPIPPNPGEMAASKRFATVLETLKAEADLVLVDSPAMLAVGDTPALAASVDGMVFLVDMDTAKRPQLYTAAEQLMRLPTKMLGVVLRTRHQQGRYYYSSYNYYGYSYTEDGSRVKDRRRKHGRRTADATTASTGVTQAATSAKSVRVVAQPLAATASAGAAGVSEVTSTPAARMSTPALEPLDVPEFDFGLATARRDGGGGDGSAGDGGGAGGDGRGAEPPSGSVQDAAPTPASQPPQPAAPPLSLGEPPAAGTSTEDARV